MEPISDEDLAKLIAEHLPSPYALDVVWRQTRDGAVFDASEENAGPESRKEWLDLVRAVREALQ